MKLVNTNNATIANGSYCSGTVISGNRVLTSAKCLSDINLNPMRVCITNRVQDARCNINAPASEHYYIRRTYVNPSFTGTVGTGSDAAVVQFDRQIQPFPLLMNGVPQSTPPIAVPPIDTQGFGDGFQGTDFGFGASTAHPELNGKKQVMSDIPSVHSSFSNYIALQSFQFLAGDMGGGTHRRLKLARWHQLVQQRRPGVYDADPTDSDLDWQSDRQFPTCTLSGHFIYSTIAGKCVEGGAIGTSTVSLNFCQCKTSQRWDRVHPNLPAPRCSRTLRREGASEPPAGRQPGAL